MSKVLVGKEALNFVSKYIDIAKSKEFSSEKDVIQNASKFPFILKISSEKLVHKTETGAVVKIINKQHLLETINTFKDTCKKYNISNFSFFMQEYVSGVELIIGLKKDPSFGHIVVFGLGGIYVELFKDLQFRANPINKKDVLDMISQLKNKKIIEGFRCLPSANKELLINSVLGISKLAEDHPEIIELDINPIICNEKLCKAVDVRIVLD